MKRAISLAAALVVIVGSLAAPAAAGPRGTTRTFVAGGWEGSPPAVPTSIDPATGKFTVVGHAIWNGSWAGVSVFHMTGTLNMSTGDYVATAETEFTGTWVGENSTGTLKWHEEMTGNFITGLFEGTIDIISGTGDRAFQCSSGHLTWEGYTNPVVSYGGYQGTWRHGCEELGKA